MSTKKTAPKKITKTTKVHKKVSGQSRQFLKVYWPYIPLLALVFFGMGFGYNWRSVPTKALGGSGVLAYATEMSSSNLLSATNSQRSQNGGLAGLKINAKLTSAAQAKANDMVARNYWSHNTPDGKEPWTFVDAAGYDYQKAGENLAYGFDTSSNTVVGWMNSASHRANILDTTYTEVGFGFANASAYVGTGEETVVVAMYAKPTTAAAATPSKSATPSTSTAAPKTKTTPTPVATPAPAAQPTKEDTVVAETKVEEPKKLGDDRYNQAITSDSPVPASQPATRITKLQTLTSGYAPWSAAVLSGTAVLIVGLWVLKHAYTVKRVLVNGEVFLLHHPIIDVGVLTFVTVAILLSQSSGVVK